MTCLELAVQILGNILTCNKFFFHVQTSQGVATRMDLATYMVLTTTSKTHNRNFVPIANLIGVATYVELTKCTSRKTSFELLSFSILDQIRVVTHLEQGISTGLAETFGFAVGFCLCYRVDKGQDTSATLDIYGSRGNFLTPYRFFSFLFLDRGHDSSGTRDMNGPALDFTALIQAGIHLEPATIWIQS